MEFFLSCFKKFVAFLEKDCFDHFLLIWLVNQKTCTTIRKRGVCWGSILGTVSYYFFSCSHGGTRRYHFEIEFGKNLKTYTRALKKKLS